MDKLWIFSMSIIAASTIMFVFVMGWREMTYNHCKMYRPDVFKDPAHPFTAMSAIKEMFMPLLSVAIVAFTFGSRTIELDLELFSYIVPACVMGLYFYTQAHYVEKCVQISSS